MWNQLKKSLRRVGRREDGSSIIELAIVFPILLLLFVGVAELGRLFFTYTTLAKATKSGARYLSSSRKVTKGSSTEIDDEKTRVRNLVICGKALLSCAGETPIVPGLTAANVTICDNFAVPCNPIIPASQTKYFRVEIQNYPYTPGVFNIATMTGQAANVFYFALTPGTEMRYMPS
jgi:Flp pilus assembly protein TadG